VELAKLVQQVYAHQLLQESHWLEWKSQADLADKAWLARVARFVLGVANRSRGSNPGPYEGRAFLLLGAEPGQVTGTSVVDPAVVTQGLQRFLGTPGPQYAIDYVATVGGAIVAVVTVPPPPPGNRPYLARASFSREKEELREGRIYIRRAGVTAEATAGEVDEMLAERVSVRMAAGPVWPLQAESVWRDGDTLHVQKRRGDTVQIYDADVYTNLGEMAAVRPPLPTPLPDRVRERTAVFDQLLSLADADPHQAVTHAWPPLRAIVTEAFERRIGPLPMKGFKVIDMVAALANRDVMDARWVDVAYPLYYWSIDQRPETLAANTGLARTYIALARALAAAVLLVDDQPGQ